MMYVHFVAPDQSLFYKRYISAIQLGTDMLVMAKTSTPLFALPKNLPEGGGGGVSLMVVCNIFNYCRPLIGTAKNIQ
jgi:hypothetical protein